MAEVLRILETALYVDDVDRSREFYQRLFGFPVVVHDDRLCALRVGDAQVLLLFRRGGSTAPIDVPGGRISPHDAQGEIHFAFLVPAGSLPEWEERLARGGVAVENRVRWNERSESLYFRDPDGHLGELVTPGLWGLPD